MENTMNDDFFAPPPFKPDEALMQLKRTLREMRPLAERGSGFDLAGQRVLDLRCEGDTLIVQLAKQPGRTVTLESLVLRSHADVRRCLDEVKKRFAQWTED
jgi:hypothetical protein